MTRKKEKGILILNVKRKEKVKNDRRKEETRRERT